MATESPPTRSRDFMRPRHVAELIGVRVETVVTLIKSGLLPASDLSLPGSSRPRFFVRREDLDNFIESRQVAPPKPKARAKPAKRPAGAKQWF